MASAPGLNPHNIRLPGDPLAGVDLSDIQVEVDDSVPDDEPETDAHGNIIKIEHGDGSVTVSLDGSPLEGANDDKDRDDWFQNLALKLTDAQLGVIAEQLLRGVDDDLQSRNDWIETRRIGIELLGLKLKVPGLQGGADGSPVEGMSTVQHPVMLEAVLRFQANARSELLPTDGPAKIRDDSNNQTVETDQLATDFERDFNHYLTAVATEYYPDTDRMFLMLGSGGTSFKKVYFCPLRSRPVSETVDAADLIVDNEATDLQNAKRVTHRIMMRPSVVKRMQILDVYRDIPLGQPQAPKNDAVRQEKKEQQGISQTPSNPSDYDREIYECYCELELPGYEHRYKGKLSGLEVPYRVTIDVSSREVLSIIRDYDDDDDQEKLPVRRKTFVKYTFVPGFGFYDIGLINILGNTTNAVTAAWRIMLDNGMYANFPGFLVSDVGGRQETNIFRVPPGGGAQIKTAGMPINQAVMPLPYQTQGQAALQSLQQDMVQTAMRVGGTSEQQVGEGRLDAPVGTTLALIEQAVKIMNAVHKRLHSAQDEELQLLKQCFKEHPESFWQRGCQSKTQWDVARFQQALENCDLVPKADPNTASQSQRLMKIFAVKELQKASPSLYNPLAIDAAALQAIGWSNPNQFFAPPEAQAKPPPELQEIMAKIAISDKDAQSRQMVAGAKVAETQAKIQSGAFAPKGNEPPAPPPPPDPVKMAELQFKSQEAERRDAQQIRELQFKQEDLGFRHAELGQDQQAAMLEAENRMRDRESHERISAVGLAEDLAKIPGGMAIARKILGNHNLLGRLENDEEPIPSLTMRGGLAP